MRNAAREMLVENSPGDRDHPHAHRRWPLEHGGLTISFRFTGAQVHELALRRTGEDVDTPPLAVMTFPLREAPHGFALVADMLFVLTYDNHVMAMPLQHHEDDWEPLWRFDPLVDPPADPDRRRYPLAQVQAADEGLLVSTHERIVLLDTQGRPLLDYRIADPWEPNWDGFGHRLTLTEDRIYYRDGFGLMVLDRETGQEQWRHQTHRRPYIPLIHLSDEMILVQIGSNAPQTLSVMFRPEERRHEALRQGLGELTPARRVAALRLLRAYGEGYHLKHVRQWLASIDGDADAEQREAARVARELMRNWPSYRSPERLAAACVAALTDAAADDEPTLDALTNDRALCWAVLQEILLGRPLSPYGSTGVYGHAGDFVTQPPGERSTLLDQEQLSALVTHARQVIADGPAEERSFAASVLVAHEVGASLLREGELDRLARHDDPRVWHWAAAAMARAGQREELIELAEERPEAREQIAWLLWPGTRRGEMTEAEVSFWVDLARVKPGSVAYIHRARVVEGGTVPEALYQPIRAYLEAEIADPQVLEPGQQPAYHLHAALQVLGSFNKPEDTALLQRYLDHPVLSDRAREVLRSRAPDPPID